MRSYILFGLVSIANAINPEYIPSDSFNSMFYVLLFFGVIFDIIEFTETKKIKVIK